MTHSIKQLDQMIAQFEAIAQDNPYGNYHFTVAHLQEQRNKLVNDQQQSQQQ